MEMSRDEVKRLILQLVDDQDDEWLKAAFYSDEAVKPILERLYSAWEEAGRQGIPLDYATDDELETLLSVARRYAAMSRAERQMIALRRMTGEDVRVELGLVERIKRLLGLG